jgi:hypothetical protein
MILSEASDQWVDCTGDVVVGDTIRFSEAVWGGSHKSPKKLGDRIIEAEVVKDSYGALKQQHTFTLVVIKSSGYQPLDPGDKILRKGRNVYRSGCERLLWDDESNRGLAAKEKHQRGDAARRARDRRKDEDGYYK